MKQLHILNGEATLHQWQSQELPGQPVVWHDVLVEGPVHAQVGSEAYHNLRQNYLAEAYHSTAAGYQQKAMPVYEALARSADYDEAVLWFEYDLFCQINLLAVLAALHQQQASCTVSLICIGRVPGHARLVGLGEVNPNLYPAFYANRTVLTHAQVAKGAQLWQLYCQPNPIAFVKACQGAGKAFAYLPAAAGAHVQRFPSRLNGLNEIEQYIIAMVHEKPRTEKEIMRALLLRANNYGFGDLQYYNTLAGLQHLLTQTNDKYALTDVGLVVHNHQNNFLNHRNAQVYLGGAAQKQYLWVQPNNELMPV